MLRSLVGSEMCIRDRGYDVIGINTPYRAPDGGPIDEEALYNAGGIFVNATGEEQTIVAVDLDVNITRAGADGNARFELNIVTRVDDPNNPGSFLYDHTTTSVQTFGGTGFRTFEYLPRAGGITVGVGNPISVTLTDLSANQVVDVTGIRFSSTTASWLNPVYPLGVGDVETIDVWRGDVEYDVGDQVTLVVNTGDIEAGSGSEPNVPLTGTVLRFQFIEGNTFPTTTTVTDLTQTCLLYTSPSPRDS